MADYKNITTLKKQIYDFKRNVSSANSDYLTGYLSALSVVEGMIAGLPSRSLIEVVCPYYHLNDCSAMPPDNISAFIDVETRLVVARAEATKDFAERLVEERLAVVALKGKTDEYTEGYHDALCFVEEQVDNLAKETVGDTE